MFNDYRAFGNVVFWKWRWHSWSNYALSNRYI